MSSGRGTLRDPILERMAETDPEGFERCLAALADLGLPAAVALTHLAVLPVSTMAILAQHPDSTVRSGVAAHPACPAPLLAQLATDSEARVRRCVAGNQSASAELLLALAADPGDYVRLEVGRNPVASDEAKAAVALSSTPELVNSAQEIWAVQSEEEDPSLSEDRIREIFDLVVQGKSASHGRLGLARNPSLPEDLADLLVPSAIDAREQFALWSRGLASQFEGGLVWPSSHAFMVASAPDWLRDSLARNGHPAALIYPGLACRPFEGEYWEGLRDLINSELLVRALWRELALSGVVELVYWNNTYEGDSFFPQLQGLNLMDGNTVTEKLIGGYSSDREWIETEDSLETYAVLRMASMLFEDWIETQVEEFDDDSLSLFALAGAAWAEDLGHAVIRWTEAGTEAVENQLWESMSVQADANDYDTKVTVTDSRLPWIGYSATSDMQKAWLAELIQQSRSNIMVGTWGLADHFLMCIALHPDTPTSVRDQLLMDPSESVREAARLGSEMATGC